MPRADAENVWAFCTQCHRVGTVRPVRLRQDQTDLNALCCGPVQQFQDQDLADAAYLLGDVEAVRALIGALSDQDA